MMPAMRTFQIRPGDRQHDAHHLWVLVAVDDDGEETVIGNYQTMREAEAAKVALEQGDVDVRS